MAFDFVDVKIGAQGWQSALHLVQSEDVLTLEVHDALVVRVHAPAAPGRVRSGAPGYNPLGLAAVG